MFGWLSRRGTKAPASAVEAAERLITEGNRAEDAGELVRACTLYREAVTAAPRHARAHLNLGIGLEAAGDAAGAKAAYEGALEIEPANAAANYNLGKLLYTLGELSQARLHLQRALEARADFPEARIVHGYVLRSLGELEAAAGELKAGLDKRPDDSAASAALSALLASIAVRGAFEHHAAGRRPEARAAYEAVLAQDPQNVDALHLLGVLALDEGQLEQADELISRSLQLQPSNARAQFNLGRLRRRQRREADALACYRQAASLAPGNVEALFELAVLYGQRGELEQALAAYRRLLEAKPGHAAALCNLGTTLKFLGRTPEAIESYRKAAEADPQFADPHYNLGVAYRDQGRGMDALAAFRRAIALRPEMTDAHFGLGHALRDMNRNAEALASFREALALDSDHVQARWSIAVAQLPVIYALGEDPRACRWRFAEELTALEAWFDERRTAMGALAVGSDQPFELAYQEENNRELLARYGALCGRLMDHWRRSQNLPPPSARRHRPLRVGIVSAHLRFHSVWSAITKGWFERLDRQRFALYAFNIGVEEDEETAFARSRAARYERGPKELRQWADAILAQELDVLIYPEIGMDPMTVRLASQRLASVQATSWGHPETSGLPSIDYYLSGADLEPADAQANYTERLVALPGLGCYFRRFHTASAPPVAAQAGIEPGVPVLICPGVPFKYAPQFDWVFPAIARELGRCRLVFFTHAKSVLSERLADRLRAVFAASGLDYARFVSFVPWQRPAGFLGWLERADVYLDTIGFSGFNTALYAVEAGLPIVTREGRFLRGRLASGILKRLELPELIAPTEQAYVDLAVRLVQDQAYRDGIVSKMQSSRDRLYEDPAPVQALEEFLSAAAPSAR